jgi:FkbM family methyltransferase
MDRDQRRHIQNSRNAGDLFEQIIISLYRAFLKPSSVAIDGGANTGWHTFQMADVATCGTIHAFEALPILCTMLRQRGAKFGSRVRINQTAIGDTVGEADFDYYDAPDPNHPNHPHWNAGLSALKSGPDRQDKHYIVIKVSVTTLDTYFVALGGFPSLDFVKLDIEGAEYSALKGAEKTLATTRPLIVFEDGGPSVGKLYGYAPSALPSLLHGLGYDLFDILGEPYTEANWINRSIWRPWYSIAVPKDYTQTPAIQTAIDGALAEWTAARRV